VPLLSPLYLSKLVCARGVRPTIACFGTTVLTARKTGETSVSINVLRARLDVAAIPVSEGGRALAVCQALFGDRFDLAASALAIALVNINPVAHAGLALGNLTRIELGGVAAIRYRHGRRAPDRRSDAEGRAVAAASVCPYARRSNTTSSTRSTCRCAASQNKAALLHARGGAPGDRRRSDPPVLEDAPFGLGFTATAARIAGIKVPLTDACIELYRAMGPTSAAENDLLPALTGGIDAAEASAWSRGGGLCSSPLEFVGNRQSVAVCRKAAKSAGLTRSFAL
jgi:opine dehydrogenase